MSLRDFMPSRMQISDEEVRRRNIRRGSNDEDWVCPECKRPHPGFHYECSYCGNNVKRPEIEKVIFDSSKEYVLVYDLENSRDEVMATRGTIVKNVRADERETGYLFDVDRKTHYTYYQWMLAENTEKNLALIQQLYAKQAERDRIAQEVKNILKQIQYAPLPRGRSDEEDDERSDS